VVSWESVCGNSNDPNRHTGGGRPKTKSTVKKRSCRIDAAWPPRVALYPKGSDVRQETSFDRRLKIVGSLLFWFGLATLSAFVAAILPARWLQEISASLGYPNFPEHPLALYLARDLSVFYGLAGVIVIWSSRRLPQMLPMVELLGKLVIALGLWQLIIVTWSGLPLWWIIAESVPRLFFGSFTIALARWARPPAAS
jgi:hypothetical protein